ncbi:MAG: YfcE family phosphodiesterase [Candidatus Nanohaloarchaea archaeon]
MIAAISDSHIPNRAEEIPEEFHGEMEEAETVVHCGDFQKEEVYRALEERYSEFYGVKGNGDFFELPSSETFEKSGIKFGVYHGAGINPRGHLPTVVETAEKLGVDVLIAGHTHQQRAVESEGKIVLNPGSCTGARGGSYPGGNPEMMTVGVEEGVLQAKLIELVDGEKISETKRFEVEP